MSPASGAAMPKPSATAAAAFAALLPDAPGVIARPMFGNPAAFINGNMFTGLFGDSLFVRLSETDGQRLRAAGGTDFAPMPGRPMKGYTTLPAAWASDVESARRWVEASLDWAKTLPPKVKSAGGAGNKKR